MQKKIESYYPSAEGLEILQDGALLGELLTGGVHVQDIFEFSNEVMGDFYRLASRLFDEGRFEDAANAFVFLTTCNPDVPEYWIALGLSLEQTDESSGAYDAYAMGAYLAKDNITYYVKAVDAAVASPLPGRAEALVDLAKSMLELGLETRSEFAGEVKQLEAYVREKLKGGR